MPKITAHVFEKKWRSNDVKIQEDVEFSSLLLSDRVLLGLKKAGYKNPSPIQLEAIPIGRFGKDVVLQAKSGTGKTLVFTVIALEMLLDVQRPQVLILAPTREIAFQVCDVIRIVGSEVKGLKCRSFIGGFPVSEDKENADGCQVVVGTPGRIKQLINMNILKTNSIRLFVLDEADNLLDPSFKSDIDAIFLSLPKEKQVIASSATYPRSLKKLVSQYFRDPFIARLNINELALLGIIHYIHMVSFSKMPLYAYKIKLDALEKILTTVKFTQSLVFCNLISRVEPLCSDIKKWGFSATYISSAREQSARIKAIDCLKRFKCKVLVSSDVTARGIDAENVDLVINFDLPVQTCVYLHRVGRAGRYGSKGAAVTFVTENESEGYKKIEEEGDFNAFVLPDPFPSNLINIRPEFPLQSVNDSLDSESVADDESDSEVDNRTNTIKAGNSNADKTACERNTNTECDSSDSAVHELVDNGMNSVNTEYTENNSTEEAIVERTSNDKLGLSDSEVSSVDSGTQYTNSIKTKCTKNSNSEKTVDELPFSDLEANKYVDDGTNHLYLVGSECNDSSTSEEVERTTSNELQLSDSEVKHVDDRAHHLNSTETEEKTVCGMTTNKELQLFNSEMDKHVDDETHLLTSVETENADNMTSEKARVERTKEDELKLAVAEIHKQVNDGTHSNSAETTYRNTSEEMILEVTTTNDTLHLSASDINTCVRNGTHPSNLVETENGKNSNPKGILFEKTKNSELDSSDSEVNDTHPSNSQTENNKSGNPEATMSNELVSCESEVYKCANNRIHPSNSIESEINAKRTAEETTFENHSSILSQVMATGSDEEICNAILTTYRESIKNYYDKVLDSFGKDTSADSNQQGLRYLPGTGSDEEICNATLTTYREAIKNHYEKMFDSFEKITSADFNQQDLRYLPGTGSDVEISDAVLTTHREAMKNHCEKMFDSFEKITSADSNQQDLRYLPGTGFDVEISDAVLTTYRESMKNYNQKMLDSFAKDTSADSNQQHFRYLLDTESDEEIYNAALTSYREVMKICYDKMFNSFGKVTSADSNQQDTVEDVQDSCLTTETISDNGGPNETEETIENVNAKSSFGTAEKAPLFKDGIQSESQEISGKLDLMGPPFQLSAPSDISSDSDGDSAEIRHSTMMHPTEVEEQFAANELHRLPEPNSSEIIYCRDETPEGSDSECSSPNIAGSSDESDLNVELASSREDVATMSGIATDFESTSSTSVSARNKYRLQQKSYKRMSKYFTSVNKVKSKSESLTEPSKAKENEPDLKTPSTMGTKRNTTHQSKSRYTSRSASDSYSPVPAQKNKKSKSVKPRVSVKDPRSSYGHCSSAFPNNSYQAGPSYPPYGQNYDYPNLHYQSTHASHCSNYHGPSFQNSGYEYNLSNQYPNVYSNACYGGVDMCSQTCCQPSYHISHPYSENTCQSRDCTAWYDMFYNQYQWINYLSHY